MRKEKIKVILEFGSQEEIDIFRKILCHGMFDLVNNEADIDTIEGVNEAKEVFDVYVSIFDQLVNR